MKQLTFLVFSCLLLSLVFSSFSDESEPGYDQANNEKLFYGDMSQLNLDKSDFDLYERMRIGYNYEDNTRRELIVVPVKYNGNIFSKKKNLSLGLFEPNGSSGFELKKIVRIFSFEETLDYSYAIDEIAHMFLEHEDVHKFDGGTIVYNLDGSIDNSVSFSKNKEGFREAKIEPKDILKSCTDWYWNTYYNGVLVSSEYVGTTCSNEEDADSDEYDGGGASCSNQKRTEFCQSSSALPRPGLSSLYVTGRATLKTVFNDCEDTCETIAGANLDVSGGSFPTGFYAVGNKEARATHIGGSKVEAVFTYTNYSICLDLRLLSSCAYEDNQVHIETHRMESKCACN